MLPHVDSLESLCNHPPFTPSWPLVAPKSCGMCVYRIWAGPHVGL